jgi:hypothetical protein
MKRRRNIAAGTIGDPEPRPAGDRFRSRWLEHLGLQPDWRECARAHLEKLRFADLKDTWPLIESLFTIVPEILNREPVRKGLAEAYAWCCYAFWQCESGFPAFPETYASFLLEQLQAEQSRNFEMGSLLASLFSNADDPQKWSGINHPRLEDPSVIRAHEALVRDGRYEELLNGRIKYDEYEGTVRASAELKNEWAEIKRLFPDQTKGRDIIHRSLVPERNWVRGAGATFESEEASFRAILDVFCWKYYLWAIKGDEPLLMKPSIVFTPFGTEIFIPGYISFDPKRDLKLGVVSRLHRARGVRRQGDVFSVAWKEHEENAKLAFEYNEQAKAAGKKGDKRLGCVAKKLGRITNGGYREIRRLIAEGKKLMGK